MIWSEGSEASELTLIYTGSTDGVIWACASCSAEPRGGLARRAALLQRLKGETPGLLLVDSGDLLSARGRPVGDRRVPPVYRLLAYDAVNVGHQEFINGTGFFRDEVLSAGLPLVSAGLRDGKTGGLFVEPYLIRETAGLRVALLGLVDAQAFTAIHPRLWEGVTTASLSETVQRFVPSLRRQADVLVVLSNLGSEGDRDLAEEVPEIDVIVGGHPGPATSDPIKVGSTLIVRPGTGGEQIGRLDLQLDGARRITGYRHALIPVVASTVEGVSVGEAGSQKETASPRSTRRLFTPSEPCAVCHPRAMQAWLQSGHARAYDQLPADRRGNLGCLPCHATGWAEGGYLDEERTPGLQHVGCTSCHVMRRKHLSWPAKSPVSEVTEENCRQCHTPARSPDFSFAARWARIAH
ncbi:MAG: multiheme c-type cytochrome [Candidatus Latescibacterota bacterium]